MHWDSILESCFVSYVIVKSPSKPSMGRRHRKLSSCYTYGTVHDKNYAATIFCACTLHARALDALRDHTK